MRLQLKADLDNVKRCNDKSSNREVRNIVST
jgi:hypothetical protein